MKLCPACSRVYDDDSLRFCLEDGTNLVDKSAATVAPPTLALPTQQSQIPTMKQAFQPASAPVDEAQGPPVVPPTTEKRRVLPWLLAAAALLFLGSSIVLAVFVMRPKSALLWHLTLEVDPATPDREAAVKQTVDILKSRLDAFGVSNFEVVRQGDGRITLNLPSVTDPERLKELITQGGKLELAHVISPPSPAPAQSYSTREAAVASFVGGAIPANRRVLPYSDRAEAQTDKKWIVVELPAIVNGGELRDARAAPSAYRGDNYNIQFSLKQSGAAKFGAWTAANINEYLGVVLNDEVKSVAYIKSQNTDQGQISGRFTRQSAEDLALALRTGALPAPVKLVNEVIDKP
jgi:protein-export membrane protein SecD